MQTIHTSYIKKLADETGKSYRELETIWKQYEREVEEERMFDPNKFSHMKSQDGSLSQEVGNRFEEFLKNPLGGDESDEIEEEYDELESEEIWSDDTTVEDTEVPIDGESIESTESTESDVFDDFDFDFDDESVEPEIDVESEESEDDVELDESNDEPEVDEDPDFEDLE